MRSGHSQCRNLGIPLQRADSVSPCRRKYPRPKVTCHHGQLWLATPRSVGLAHQTHRLRGFRVAFSRHKSGSGAAHIAVRARRLTSARAGPPTQSLPLVRSRSSSSFSSFFPPSLKGLARARRLACSSCYFCAVPHQLAGPPKVSSTRRFFARPFAVLLGAWSDRKLSNLRQSRVGCLSCESTPD